MSLSATTEAQADQLPPPAAPAFAEPARVRRPRGRVAAWLARPVNLFLLLCSLLPLVFVISFVTDSGVNMPLLDDWKNGAIIAVKTADGTLTLPDLFQQVVSHRIVFSNLYTAITTLATGWNVKFDLYFIVFLAGLCCVFLAMLFYKDQPRALSIVLVPFSVITFSVRQNINWLLSTQTSWFFVLVFFLLGVLALRLRRQSLTSVAIAGAFAICATYSSLQGLASWPALLLLMVLLGYRGVKYYAVFFIFALIGVGSFALSFDYTSGTPADGFTALLSEPYRLPLYLATYLGNSFVIIEDQYWPLAATLGVLGVLFCVVNAVYLVRKRGSARVVATWVAIALWAMTTGVLTGIGRTHYFPEPNPRHPMLDRYVLPASLLWIAFTALSVMTLYTIARYRRGRTEIGLTIANVSLIVVLVGLFGWATLWSYDLQPYVTQSEYECMRRFPATRNIGCMTRGLLDTITQDELLGGLNGLAIHQLAAFRDIEPIYTDIVPLYSLPRDESRERRGARFAFFEFQEGVIRPVFHQPAPSVSMFRIDVPQTEQPVVFFSAVYVNVPAEISGPAPDGVIFRVGLRTSNGEERLLTEIDYDLAATEALRRVLLPLDDYRGQTIELYLQTDDRDNPNADNAMWVDPGVMVLQEQENG